jgi:DNA-binding transcriptional LysR family regulator
MDRAQLLAFLAVAEELHFGRAAGRLHVAQPHLTRTIRALESQVAAVLFRRTTRRVELTAAGATFVEHARELVAADQRARDAVAAAAEGRSGRVRVGFSGPSAHDTLGTLARAVREAHPLVDLELLPGRYGSTAVAELVRGELDLALARFSAPPTRVGSRPVAQDRFVLALPDSHRLGASTRVSIADLRDEPLIAFPESYGSVVRATLVARCQEAGFTPRFVQSTPDSSTAMALVAAGVGAHLTTRQAVSYLPLAGVAIREIADPLPPLAVHLAWRADDDALLRRVLRTSETALPTIRVADHPASVSGSGMASTRSRAH